MGEEVSLKKRPPPPPSRKPQSLKQRDTTLPAVVEEVANEADVTNAEAIDSGIHITNESAIPTSGTTVLAATPIIDAPGVAPSEQAAAISQPGSISVASKTDEVVVAVKSDAGPTDHADDLSNHGDADPQAEIEVDSVTATESKATRKILEDLLPQLRIRIESLEARPAGRLGDSDERLESRKTISDESDSEDEESDTDRHDPEEYKALSFLNVISIADWDKRDFSRKRPHALIDVVVSQSYFQTISESSDSSMKTAVNVQDPFNPDGDHTEHVKFIQVNSLPLLRLYFHVIDDEDLPDDQLQIILAPFKGFTAFITDFQQVMSNLESTWGSKAREDPRAQIAVRVYEKTIDKDKRVESDKNISSDKSAKKDKLSSKIARGEKPELYEDDDFKWDSYEAYIGGKAWTEFYHRFVRRRWEWFRSDRVTKITFGDLCNLYQPGDVVYEPDAEQKVWRVTKVTGGRPVLQTLLYGTTDGEEGGGKGVRSSLGDGSGGHKLRDDAAQANEGRRQVNDWTLLSVEGYYLNFNGTTYGPVHKHQQIKYYPGKREVRSLKMWPLRLLNHDHQKMEELTKAGVTFFEKCLPALHHYDGRTLTKSSSGVDLSVRHPKYRAQDLTSAVYVDLLRAYQNVPGWNPVFGIDDFVDADKREIRSGKDYIANLDSKFRNSADFDEGHNFDIQNMSYAEKHVHNKYCKEDKWILEPGGHLTDERESVNKLDWILFPNRVCGFVFQTRSWACFDVDDNFLKEVPKDDSAWAQLALPPTYKATLESLVELHFANKKATGTRRAAGYEYDFIQGKGAGLVVLLHGHPGVGKTSTAESIAIKYQKPLLPITCGNLGVDAQRVEEALTENFQLAQAWDAIVLLDEADVFLSRRDNKSVERNALVSVFLRTLEYYTGVLFLTTNRVGAFDGAFISRVHASLYYDSLDEKQTLAIWTHNLKRLIRQGEQGGNRLQIIGMGDDIRDFAREHFIARHNLGKDRVWNGRQIRNAFQSAVALAQYEAKQQRGNHGYDDTRVELKAAHFAVVAEASANFEKYLQVTRNHTDGELMDMEGERAENYIAPTPSTQFGTQSTLLGHDRQTSETSYEETFNVTPGNSFTPRTLSSPMGQPLVRKPTLNSRLQHIRSSASPQPQTHIGGLPSNAQAPFAQRPKSQQSLTQPSAPPSSGIPAGLTVVIDEQGQRRLVPLQNAEPAQPTIVHGHMDTYQHFDQQTVAGDTMQYEHGNTIIHTDNWNHVPPQSYPRSPAPQPTYIKSEPA